MGNKLGYPEVDLSGKVAIVTGGNTGIGYETAKGLARLGAHTFIACRSKERAEAAIEQIKSELSEVEKKEPEASGSKGDSGLAEETGVEGEGGAVQEATVDSEGKGESAAEGGQDGGSASKETEEEEEEEGAVQGATVNSEAKGENVAEGGQDGSSGKETGGEEEGGAVQEAAGSSEAKGEGAAEGGQDGGSGEEEQVENKDKEASSEKKEVKVDFLPLDLSSFQSTTEFVRAFKEKNLPLHILINNAAVAWIPFRTTSDGYEEQFQVNHLSPMLLTLELLPILLETAASSGEARIVLVSSKASSMASPFQVDKLVVEEEADYDRLKTYPNTKLYNVMVGYALQRRLKDTGITISCPEPGSVKTELVRGWEDKTFLAFLTKVGYATFFRTPVEGAATSLYCAVNPDLNTQQCHFYSDCKVATPTAQASNKQFQELLWEKSIEILKDHLSPEILATATAPPPEGTTTDSKNEDQ